MPECVAKLLELMTRKALNYIAWTTFKISCLNKIHNFMPQEDPNSQENIAHQATTLIISRATGHLGARRVVGSVLLLLLCELIDHQPLGM